LISYRFRFLVTSFPGALGVMQLPGKLFQALFLSSVIFLMLGLGDPAGRRVLSRSYLRFQSGSITRHFGQDCQAATARDLRPILTMEMKALCMV
jgi:hypothetical protein